MRRSRGAVVRLALSIGVSVAGLATLACASARLGPPGRSVVLPAEQLDEVLGQCSRSGPTVREVEGTWEVPPEVVARLDADLPQLRRVRATECCFLRGRVRDPGAYLRQVLGIVLDGRQVVYINAVESVEERSDWRERAITVCDGGDGYWGAVYDPRTRRFSRLGINGDA